MLKKILALSVIVLISKLSYGQCAIEPWSLKKRIDLSTLVIEGKVIQQYPFREVGKNAIYTASIIEIYKVFKGTVAAPYLIEIITFGGQIGLEKHHADPELDLHKDELGIFLLTNNSIDLPDFVKSNNRDKYQGTASVQSIITYELDENKAYDVEQYYNGITTVLYESIQTVTQKTYLPVGTLGFDPSKLKKRALAGPVITGYGTTSSNAGTGEILTIKGQGFLNSRGNGRVEFVDANYGDGRRTKTPYAADYTFWNDTQIRVRIPSRAGSGTIKVATNDSGAFTTFSNYKMNYSHLNVSYQPTGGSEQFYPTDHINNNSKGGYTFQLNTRFKANKDMVNSFLRSLETWRCGTLMNWDVGRDTSIKITNGDKVNIVRLTKYTDSRLAVCYSYWQGCYIGGTNMEWYVNELDIEIDSTRNWYYGIGTFNNSQYDFQSVLSHELGHGHQLGHVIASSEMMHYSISNGQKKSTLSANDLAGGNFVKDKSIKNNACSGSPMKALSPSSCGYTKPLSGFKANKITLCPNLPITLTDTSIGVVKSYLWNFGKDANPATANTVGPHTITYSTEGTKTIILYVTNDFGTDTSTKKDYIKVMPDKPTKPTNLVYTDTACLGATLFKVDTFYNNNTLVWQFPSQATSTSSTKNTRTILWNTSGGPFTFWVKASNSCGSSDSIVGQAMVLNYPTSAFTKFEDGRTVTFTNTSQYATSYKWIFGDGDSSSLKNPVHIYPMGKAYNAKLTSINKCKSVFLSLIVNPFHPADINDLNLTPSMAYPNPTHHLLFLSKNVVSYQLMDATGKLIKTGTESFIDFSELAKGIYILNTPIYNGQNFYTKIIKE